MIFRDLVVWLSSSLSQVNIENLQNNCLTAIEKSIEGTWAYDFWTNTFDKLEKNYKLIKNGEGINDNKF